MIRTLDHEVFSQAGSAILYYAGHGSCSTEQKTAVQKLRFVILRAVCDIAQSCISKKRSGTAEFFFRIMDELHPEVRYQCDEKLMRDLSDICVTLHSIEDDTWDRSNRQKLIVAKIFCYCTAGDITAMQNPVPS